MSLAESIILGLTNNASKANLPVDAALTQIRLFTTEVDLEIEFFKQSRGPTYYPYPNWTQDNIAKWLPLGMNNLIGASNTLEVIDITLCAVSGTVQADSTHMRSGHISDTLIQFEQFYQRFNATDQFVTVPSTAAMDSVTRFSIAFRMKTGSRSGLTHNDSIFCRWTATNSEKQFRFYLTPTTGYFVLEIATDDAGASNVLNFGVILDLLEPRTAVSEWYDVILSYDSVAQIAKVYFLNKDITKSVTATVSGSDVVPLRDMSAVTTNYTIARDESDTALNFRGYLKDVVLWAGKALTLPEALEFSKDEIDDRMITDFWLPNT